MLLKIVSMTQKQITCDYFHAITNQAIMFPIRIMIFHVCISSPLLGLQRSRLPPLFLKPPARLFQLCEGVGGWVGGHGWVLDEGMGGLHIVAELSGNPRVHSPRPLHRTGPRHLVTLSFLGAGDAAKEQARPKELLHDSLQKTVVCYIFATGQAFIV